MADERRNDVLRVDKFAPKMGETEFNEAINLMGGVLIEEGTDFDRLTCIADDPDQARMQFVSAMQARLTDNPVTDIEWRYKPETGTRREDADIKHVVSARFRLVPKP